jgi:hypothetical protein
MKKFLASSKNVLILKRLKIRVRTRKEKRLKKVTNR